MANDEFELYDLKVEVIERDGPCVCRRNEGDYFTVTGEELSIPPGKTFSFYELAAVIPLLAAKQRQLHDNDWMATDHEIACPDPNCGAIFRISRVGKRKFRHSETTLEPLEPDD